MWPLGRNCWITTSPLITVSHSEPGAFFPLCAPCAGSPSWWKAVERALRRRSSRRKAHKRSSRGTKKKREREGDEGRFPNQSPPPRSRPTLSSLILTPVLSSPWKARDDAAPSSPREQASGLLHNVYVRHKHAPVLTHVRQKINK